MKSIINDRTIVVTACIIIVIGLMLMSGEGTTAASFNPNIFSVRRIVIAPAVCLFGYLLVIVGILWKR